MKLLAARRRIRGTLPHYEYRVFVPLDEISAERQDLLTTRSDYGFKPGPWARVAEVIAPMDYLRLPPGGLRYDMGRDITAVAKQVETAIIRHLYPEMTAPTVPLVFAAAGEFSDQSTWARTGELTARFNHLARDVDSLTAELLGLDVLAEAEAA